MVYAQSTAEGHIAANPHALPQVQFSFAVDGTFHCTVYGRRSWWGLRGGDGVGGEADYTGKP